LTEIHPGPDQTIGAITRELEDLGLVNKIDFWLHYTWDLRPYIQTTQDAYEVWDSSRGNEDSETEQSSDDEDDADSAQATESGQARAASSRRATKRR
jgi:hypothetical protein